MSELKVITAHAGTVLVGQLATMAYGVADTLIAGHFSDAALASLSVGSAIYISVYVGLMGVVQALLPIWAELHGGKKQKALGRSLRQSIYLVALIAAVGMLALMFPGSLLRWAQVPELMLGEVQQYLKVLAFAFMPALLFRVYSSFNQSLGKPVLVTWLQVGALTVKIPLSIWFVGGGGGVAPMGAVGCAWATFAVNYLLLALAVLMLRKNALYQPYEIWKTMEKPDWPQIRQFVRLGVPGGLAYMVEVTSFTLMAVFIARLGTEASAGHQIAASIAAVLYMMPLSMAIASSARVSFWLGAGRPDTAKHIVVLALSLTALTSITFAAFIFTANEWLAGLYSPNPAIVSIGSGLLLWTALYHVADATQAVCAFLLRCYRITIAPLVIYGVLLWGLGLQGGYLLSYSGLAGHAPSQSASSFWAASTVALAFVACSFLFLLRRVTKKDAPCT